MPRTALLLVLAAAAQAGLPRGQVSDPVVTIGDAGQSYVLYLPSGYDESRNWPILYCFDPGGRGAVPVALFREAAEASGWIVAGSNNSRNGPWAVVFAAARAMWRDTHARLRIDDRRVYAAGFSGGARAASGLGRILAIQPAGVIACGGGLPDWLEPEDVAATPWFGTVGVRDFNFQEMQELERRLRRQGTPCQLRLFQGEHRWPPAALARTALAWLEGLEQETPPAGSEAVASPQRGKAAKGGREESPPVFTMPAAAESVIAVKAGTRFAIRFFSSPGTGFGWELASDPDARRLQFVEETIAEPRGEMAGGQETVIWTFKALAAGEAVIAMRYVRPWENDAEPLRRHLFRVRIDP
jgi:predicted secreted protein/dienelactone hydrolase